MRVAELATINRMVSERERLIGMKAKVSDGRALALTVDGVGVERPMLELIRPVITGALAGEIRRLETDLAQLGVEIA